MSMKSEIVYGYGFTCDDITIHGFRHFVSLHSDSIRKMAIRSFDNRLLSLLEIVSNNDNDLSLEELRNDFCDLDCNCSYRSGLFSVISNTMSFETEVQFRYEPGQDDCDGTESILFGTSLPWQYSEVEKVLTQNSLNEILSRYAKELTISSAPDFISVEYFG